MSNDRSAAGITGGLVSILLGLVLIVLGLALAACEPEEQKPQHVTVTKVTKAPGADIDPYVRHGEGR